MALLWPRSTGVSPPFAADGCFAQLECRGAATHVVRVGGSGVTHGAGEENCRDVYDEFDHL
jgi:hypothetical protein